MKSQIEGNIGPVGDKAYAHILRRDLTRDADCWKLTTIIAIHGELPRLPDMPKLWDEERIVADLQGVGLEIVPVGERGPGQPFAEAPWLQILGGGRTIIVSQRGGRDV